MFVPIDQTMKGQLSLRLPVLHKDPNISECSKRSSADPTIRSILGGHLGLTGEPFGRFSNYLV